MRALLCAVALCWGLQARADVVLEFDAGNINSDMMGSLSGSGTAINNFSGTTLTFTGLGDFYQSTATLIPYGTGSASFTNVDTATTVGISSLTVGQANGGFISINLDSTLSFTTGQSYTAQFTPTWVIPVDLGSFAHLGLPYQVLDAPASAGFANLDLTIGASHSVAVPEVSSFLACGGAGLLAIAGAWLRRKRQ